MSRLPDLYLTFCDLPEPDRTELSEVLLSGIEDCSLADGILTFRVATEAAAAAAQARWADHIRARLAANQPEFFVHTVQFASRPEPAAPRTTRYEESLRSEHWKDLVRQLSDQCGGRCQLCNREGPLHGHHRTYERLGHEVPQDVTMLCPRCHAKFHDIVHVDELMVRTLELLRSLEKR